MNVNNCWQLLCNVLYYKYESKVRIKSLVRNNASSSQPILSLVCRTFSFTPFLTFIFQPIIAYHILFPLISMFRQERHSDSGCRSCCFFLQMEKVYCRPLPAINLFCSYATGWLLSAAPACAGRFSSKRRSYSSQSSSRKSGCAIEIKARARSRRVFPRSCATPYSVTI